MKRLVFAAVLACVSLGFAQSREVVRPGDPGLNREAPPPLLTPQPDRPQPPVEVHWAPFALNVFSISVPCAPHLEVNGLRLNLTVPFATPDHQNIFGLDLGLAGETAGHVGGIAVNAFDNWSDSFSGGCVGLVNVTGELRGLQVGLVNVARSGNGLQIGLWNQSTNFRCPFIGVVW